jgi:phage gpG-like protein
MAKFNINIPHKEFKAFVAAYPKVIAQTIVTFSRDNWKKQGYYQEGTTNFKAWKRRKREYYRYRKGKKVLYSGGKDTLVSSGDLRASVKALSITKHRIVVGSTLSYADKHNEGRGSMPKRTFINDNKKQGRLIENRVTLLMKRKGL